MDWREELRNIETDISEEEVFEAIRRGYNDLENATDDEIINYFENSNSEELAGHISNIKGILFENEIQDKLEEIGVESHQFEKTNHPNTDLEILEDGEVVEEIQLKATESTSYIKDTLEENPDIEIVATSEVAEHLSNEVVDSGVSDVVLEETVAEVILPISKTSIALTGIGLLFGLWF
jgi:hypothetical protein